MRTFWKTLLPYGAGAPKNGRDGCPAADDKEDAGMTWSILARDASGRLGAAIASRFFAVGALCVHARRGVGILSTQALMNPLYGPRGLALLAEGQSPEQVVAALTGADAGREQRQLHVLPAQGAPAAWTGASCIDWCGHSAGEDFSVAGNMLAGAAGAGGDGASFPGDAGPAPGASACWRRWRPARPPAATSAASRPPPCASRPTRTTRSWISASMTMPSRCRSCSASTA